MFDPHLPLSAERWSKPVLKKYPAGLLMKMVIIALRGKKRSLSKVFAQAWSTHRFCAGAAISIRGVIFFAE